MNVDYVSGVDGRMFAVRLVCRGDRYGRDGCLTHDEDDPLVEFYDTSYAGEWPDSFSGDLGQFVSRYYRDALVSHNGGLSLDGGVPVWCVSGESLATVLASPIIRGEGL